MKSYDSNNGLHITKSNADVKNDTSNVGDKKSGRAYDISGHIKKNEKKEDVTVKDAVISEKKNEENPIAETKPIEITPLSVGSKARPTPKAPKAHREPTAEPIGDAEASTRKMLIKFGVTIFTLLLVFSGVMFGKDYVSNIMSNGKQKEFDFEADAAERAQYVDCLTPIDSSIDYVLGVGDSLKFPCHAREDMYVEFQFSDYTNSVYLCDAVASNGDSVSFVPSDYLKANRVHELSIRQAVYKSDSMTPVLVSDVVIKIKVQDDSEQKAIVEAINQHANVSNENNNINDTEVVADDVMNNDTIDNTDDANEEEAVENTENTEDTENIEDEDTKENDETQTDESEYIDSNDATE